MKINNLLFYIDKHKKTICLFLVILIILSLMLHKPIIEGLTTDRIGKYDYLKPVTEVVSDDTWKNFVLTADDTCGTANANNYKCTNEEVTSKIQGYKSVFKCATTEEINYRIKNGYWPWGSYVTQQYADVINTRFTMLSDTDKQNAIEDGKYRSPSRCIYAYISEGYEKVMNPQPLSYKIYMGITPPPLPIKNYEELLSLCKSVNLA
jgi:hypothetical protein